MRTPWPRLRAPKPAGCPGRTCLLFDQDHEHAQPRDTVFESVLAQVEAFRRAEAQHAGGTWVCPGCGSPWDDLPLGHNWSYADGGTCSTAQPVSVDDFVRGEQR